MDYSKLTIKELINLQGEYLEEENYQDAQKIEEYLDRKFNL